MTAVTAFAGSLGASAAVALAVMCAAFVVGVRTGRHRGVDVAWGLAFAAIALTTFVLSASHGETVRRVLVLLMVTVWRLRLSVHLWWRGRAADEDPPAAIVARLMPMRADSAEESVSATAVKSSFRQPPAAIVPIA